MPRTKVHPLCSVKPKAPRQPIVYDIRCGEKDHELLDLLSKLPLLAKKWTFQLEKGEKNGYMHYQGRISLFKKMTKGKAKRLVLNTLPNIRYCEPTSTACKGNDFYVMKIHTRVKGPWQDCDQIDPDDEFVPRQYRGTPYLWQQQIIDTGGFNKRDINILIDKTGNIGKSFIMGYMDCNLKGYYNVPLLGTSKELTQMAVDILYKKDHYPQLLTLDIPRAYDRRQYPKLFATMENLKSGILYDGRYKLRKWKYESPQIWVFTNDENIHRYPLVSEDRYKIWKHIDHNSLLQVVEKDGYDSDVSQISY